MKFYTIHDTDGTARWLTSVGFTEVNTPQAADMIVFNGGRDIGTAIYHEKPVWRGVPYQMSERDTDEQELFESLRGDGKFFLGICRGAQLLNCLNGGTLWQHVNNHGHDHMIYDIRSGRVYRDSSEHHQQMRPDLKRGVILAVANEATNKFAQHEQFNDIDRPQNVRDGGDVEVVWYPGSRTLCLQGHPEWAPESAFAEYCLSLIKEFNNAAA